MIPKVNFGQSQFQDTFFVAGAQLTPFRQLRQLELEMQGIESSLKKADINRRRTLIKISRLNKDDELESLDIEEHKYDLEQQDQLINDAKARLANFLKMREQLLERTPEEYWKTGYEQAEVQHWTAYFGKQLAISKMTGVPNVQLVEQMMLLPEQMQKDVMQIGMEMSQPFLLQAPEQK